MKNTGGIKLIFVAALALLIVAGTSAALTLSNSGGGSWSNFREITITNSGSALTDYQVLVQLSGGSFPTTTSNGADIRFTDASGNELSYWIESWDYAGKSGSIWVKVPSIAPNGNANIMMYYGNQKASSSSNGDATFEFFDDFESGNLSKWNFRSPETTVISDNGNYVVQLKNSSLEKDASWTNYRLDLQYKIIHEGYFDGARFGVAIRRSVKGGYFYGIEDWHNESSATPEKTVYAIKELYRVKNSYYSTIGQWFYLGFSAVDHSIKAFDRNGNEIISVNDDAFQSGGITIVTWDSMSEVYVDSVRIRKYASSEPILALGAEHLVPTPPTTGNISVSSSPSDAEVLVDGISKGTAPVTVPNISPGSHAVKCKLSRYIDYDTSATVTAGNTSSVICSLTTGGELSVKLSTEPASIEPGQISTIKITVTKDEAPVSGVNVMLSSTPWVNFSSSSGTTTIGEFISTFSTSTEGEIKISALAKKEGINDGKGETVVQVGKSTPTPATPTGKQASITGKVIDAGTDDPVQDVTITVDGKSAVTGSNGDYELSVDVGKHNLSASKSGYKAMTRSVIVPDGGTVLDLSLKPASGDTSWFWIVIILILVVAAAGIIYFFYRKKKLKEKEQMEEKAKREKEAKEREEKEKREKEERERKEKEERERKEKEDKERKTKEKKSLCMYCHAPLSLGSKFCNECGKKQEEKTRFCMNCGAPMPNAPDSCPKCGKLPPSDVDTKTCKNCGEVIPIVAQFCSACGAKQPK